jgi:hypothetical protein
VAAITTASRGFVVRHAKGQTLAYVYSQDNEADALQTMTKDRGAADRS